MKRWTLSSYSAYVVSGRKLDLEITLLIHIPKHVRTPHPIFVAKATGFWSVVVKWLLPWWRFDVLIRDLSVLHADWITTTLNVWLEIKIIGRLPTKTTVCRIYCEEKNGDIPLLSRPKIRPKASKIYFLLSLLSESKSREKRVLFSLLLSDSNGYFKNTALARHKSPK